MRSLLISVFILCFDIAYSQNENLHPENNNIEYQSLFGPENITGVSCYRIPAIITTPNGDLVAVIDQRKPSCDDLRSNKDINIVMRRSKDNGATWSKMETVVDYPDGVSASDPSMIVDKESGQIFLFFNYMDLNLQKDIYYLKMISSRDNGKSWSLPVDITSQITKPEWQSDFKFITSGNGIQTSTGKLLHTMVNLNKGLFIFGSDNHGKSWFLIDTAIKPADESKIAELNDGSWKVNSRVNGAGVRYVHTSKDQGKTWSSQTDSSLIDPSCNASLIRYTSVKDGSDKNRLLFSNPADQKDRKNMTVRISYDEGKSWSAGKTIYTGSSAYSSLSILKNGDIGLFFEKDDYCDNVFVHFTLEWLTDGKDKYQMHKKIRIKSVKGLK